MGGLRGLARESRRSERNIRPPTLRPNECHPKKKYFPTSLPPQCRALASVTAVARVLLLLLRVVDRILLVVQIVVVHLLGADRKEQLVLPTPHERPLFLAH